MLPASFGSTHLPVQSLGDKAEADDIATPNWSAIIALVSFIKVIYLRHSSGVYLYFCHKHLFICFCMRTTRCTLPDELPHGA
jgi:hypothetical protein